jgi:hypothetical protein
MAALPAIAPPDPTLEAVRVAVQQSIEQDRSPRTYLGASEIGHECMRRLWYGFRWATPPGAGIDAAAQWRFDDGYRCEDVLAQRLRLVPGVHLQTLDPSTGRQFGISDLGGHFRGHLDGLITGIVQAPKTMHVWEAKAVNEKKLADLDKLRADRGEKNALRAWDAVYYAQAVIYMAYFELDRHYLTACSPGARTMTSVRTDADLDAAAALRRKAEAIITSPEPLPKINENPAWYLCKMCPAHSICHGSKMPEVNCRTCAHATPEMDGDGRWSCAYLKRDIASKDHGAPCLHHRYIPALVKFAKPVDASEEENWIQYEMPDGRVFRNGDPAPWTYTSDELRVIDPAMIGDPAGEAIRATFDARHVQPEAA